MPQFRPRNPPIAEPEPQVALALDALAPVGVLRALPARCGIDYQRNAADQAVGLDDGAYPAQPAASGILRGESQPIAAALRAGVEPQLDIGERPDRNAGGVGFLADKQTPVGIDARVEAAPAQHGMAVVVDLPAYAGAKTHPARGKLALARADAPQAHAHRKAAAVRAEIVGQQVDVAVPAGNQSLEPPLRYAPILQGVCPVLRADPRPFDLFRPSACELRGAQRECEQPGGEKIGDAHNFRS